MKDIRIELCGLHFGRLVVLNYAGKSKTNRVLWNCMCDCGNVKVILGEHLRTGHTKSCGCLKKEVITTHGGKDLPEYQAWCSMKNRCVGVKNRSAKNYVGRGIRVCPRWISSFANFFEDMGKKPSKKHSLDRYPDINGNYEPSKL